MSTKTLNVLNTNDPKEMKLFANSFIEYQKIIDKTNNKNKSSNEEYKVLYTVDSNNQVTNYCEVDFLKDLKTGIINFPLLNNRREKKFIDNVILFTYTQDIEEVVINLDINDKKTISMLEKDSEKFSLLPVEEDDSVISFAVNQVKELINNNSRRHI